MCVLLWFTVKYLFNCTNERDIFWAINEGREIVRAMVKIYFFHHCPLLFASCTLVASVCILCLMYDFVREKTNMVPLIRFLFRVVEPFTNCLEELLYLTRMKHIHLELSNLSQIVWKSCCTWQECNMIFFHQYPYIYQLSAIMGADYNYNS